MYVGNLPYSINDDRLREMFAEHGEVTDARVITDRDSGRSKGFGFVEMADDAAADKAIQALHDTEMDGRKIVVNQAREREERPRFQGGGGQGGGGGYRDRDGGGRTSQYTPRTEAPAAAPEAVEDAPADEAPKAE